MTRLPCSAASFQQNYVSRIKNLSRSVFLSVSNIRMHSRFEYLKNEAVKLRKRGKSLRAIEGLLDVPRSTLSGWLKNVSLSAKHKASLERKWRLALTIARTEAVRWHNTQRNKRLEEAAEAAEKTLQKIGDDSEMLELALAMLYLGEGGKTKTSLTLGNSDPLIVRFYVNALERLYGIAKSRLRAELHLRADQDENKLKRFWSKATGIPLRRFVYSVKDQRTLGRATYPGYKGVCAVSGGGVAIQRKLMYLAKAFTKRHS
ncbi:MAG: hypothetical protein WDN10_01880 [bacterium]